MTHFNLIVIGGDGAGMGAASQARRINKDISIAVFEKGEHVSYAACGMPYFISDDIKDYKELIAIDIDEFIDKRKIIIKTMSEVTEVDFQQKKITASHKGELTHYTYDRIVIATGAAAAIPAIPGVENEDVFVLRTLRQGINIKEYIDNKKPESAILIGGGFISLEMAETLTKKNIKITLLEKMDSVASLWSPEIQKIVAEELIKQGVTVKTGVDIENIFKEGEGLAINTKSGKFTADFIIVSTGAKPNTALFKNSGLQTLQNGAIIIDEKCRTNLKDVFAAGDCCTVKNLITGKDDYMPMATTANKQGRVAGLQAVNVTTEIFKGALGSQMVKVCDLEVAKTGFNKSDAEKHGIEVIDDFIEWKSRPGYYPGSDTVYVKLTIRKDNRKIIGGELAGKDGAALRINTVATAITAGMTVEDFAYLDTGYAPPFSPVWDPVVAAAQNFIKRVPEK
ncbi:MAG: CoA-disulfide reductase [Spirochaetae bacterium HGW-Spirochaetae-5]|nr:MAG: CoA-disulfide reductase [Spirochaetae bacterium HGW-Spirochaetae-5]